jgi:hypothetical protein
MNKSDLQKAYANAEFAFYEAKLIVDNPIVTLAELCKQHRSGLLYG